MVTAHISGLPCGCWQRLGYLQALYFFFFFLKIGNGDQTQVRMLALLASALLDWAICPILVSLLFVQTLLLKKKIP